MGSVWGSGSPTLPLSQATPWIEVADGALEVTCQLRRLGCNVVGLAFWARSRRPMLTVPYFQRHPCVAIRQTKKRQHAQGGAGPLDPRPTHTRTLPLADVFRRNLRACDRPEHGICISTRRPRGRLVAVFFKKYPLSKRS